MRCCNYVLVKRFFACAALRGRQRQGRANMTMRLHNLKPRPGAKHRTKRLGIGESSGHGKTSGRGGKGQTARSGGSVRLGFEGGQMPLLRRIPKRGFNNANFRTIYTIVNIDDLNAFDNGATVTPESLVKAGL